MRSLLLALLSSAALAQPPSANALLIAHNGEVRRIDADGTERRYVTCEVTRTYRVIVPPYDVRQTTERCTLASLVTHESTGRWAVTAMITAPAFNDRLSYVINGQPTSVPALSGDLLLLGDLDGLVGTSTGVEQAWFRENEKVRSQQLRGFSDDGQRLNLVVVKGGESKSGGRTSHWQLTFGQEPKLKAAQPPEAERLALQLGDRAAGVLVDGPHVVTYRNGGTTQRQISHTDWMPVCDEAQPATWTHLDRRSGREVTIWRDDHCRTSTSPFVGSAAKHGMVILNQLKLDRTRAVARYELATGRLTPLPIEGLAKTPLALSDDGRHLLALTYGDGLAVFDAQTGGLVFKVPVGPSKNDFLLGGFFALSPDLLAARR
jgi:hypothetical protein